jgi:hypothetical protein
MKNRGHFGSQEKFEGMVIDIQITHTRKILSYCKELDKLEELRQNKLLELMLTWKASSVFEYKNKYSLESLRRKFSTVKRMFQENLEEHKEDLKDVIKSEKIIEELFVLHKQISDSDFAFKKLKRGKQLIKSVFVTFRSRRIRQKFYKEFSVLLIKKSCSSCRSKREQVYSTKVPTPINIKWNNVDKKVKEKYFRRFISYLTYFLLFLIRNFWIIF